MIISKKINMIMWYLVYYMLSSYVMHHNNSYVFIQIFFFLGQGSKTYTAPYIVFVSDSRKGRSCELIKFCYNAPNTHDFPNNVAYERASSPRLIFDLCIRCVLNSKTFDHMHHICKMDWQ
jgi:hypothetical protein